MNYKLLRKRALIADFASIGLAGGILYFGSHGQLPEWALIVGLVLALVALIVAIVLSLKARKIERAQFEAQFKEHNDAEPSNISQ